MKFSFPAAVLAFAVPFAAAPALADETSNDVHCVIILSLLTDASAPQTQAVGRSGIVFYQGRLYGRAPDLDLNAQVAAEAPKLKGPLLRDETQRCGGDIQAMGASMQALSGVFDKSQTPPPPTSPGPQDAETNDIRCLIVDGSTAQAADAVNKPALMSSALYYLGKLSGPMPADLQKRVAAEQSVLTGATLAAESVRCDREYQPRLGAIATLAAEVDKQMGGNPFLRPVEK
jgi:hypothetical protein